MTERVIHVVVLLVLSVGISLLMGWVSGDRSILRWRERGFLSIGAHRRWRRRSEGILQNPRHSQGSVSSVGREGGRGRPDGQLQQGSPPPPSILARPEASTPKVRQARNECSRPRETAIAHLDRISFVFQHVFSPLKEAQFVHLVTTSLFSPTNWWLSRLGMRHSY